MKGRRWGVLALAAVATTALPARAQTEAGVPEISVDGAQAQPAQPVQPLPEPPAAPPPPSRADTALERVLHSGCRDGLEEVGALRGDPGAPWADTILRLCGKILRQPAAAGGPAETISESASANEGRGRLVLWSSLYGIWLGIAGDIISGTNSAQAAVLQPMLGLGLGLGTSLIVTSQHPVTTGQAWTIITGLDYASINGALWGGGLGLSASGVAGLSVLASVIATPVAVFVAATQRPKAGDIELCRSSLLWGTTAGLLAAASFSGTTAEGAWRTGAIAMDVSLAAGIGLANSFDLSRNRVLIIDSGAVGGGLIGFGMAVLFGGNKASTQALAGGALAGLIGGITIAALATHNLDRPESQTTASAPAYPALFARASDGRWSVGMPAPTPVFDGTGARAVGASLAALGGLF